MADMKPQDTTCMSLSFGVCRVSLFALFESVSMLTNRDDLILSFKSLSMPSLFLKHQTVFIESAVALVVRHLASGKIMPMVTKKIKQLCMNDQPVIVFRGAQIGQRPHRLLFIK